MQLSSIPRPIVLALGVLLGACAGTAATTVATGGAAPSPVERVGHRPGIPPATSTLGATVLPLAAAEHRQVGGGKAHIRFLAYGRQAWLGKLEMAGGGEVPVHRDATEEFIHVLSGGGVITIDGKASRIGPGSTVYMPASSEVSYRNDGAPMVALQVFAGPAPAAKYNKWQKVTP